MLRWSAALICGRFQPAPGPITFPPVRSWTADLQCFSAFRIDTPCWQIGGQCAATRSKKTPALDLGEQYVLVLPNRPSLSSTRSVGQGAFGCLYVCSFWGVQSFCDSNSTITKKRNMIFRENNRSFSDDNPFISSVGMCIYLTDILVRLSFV